MKTINFENLPSTNTPLSASKLNGLFDGAESMGSIVVEDITCKNLFNINDISSGLAINENGTSGASTKTDASGYIPVKAGQQYTFSYNYTTLSATAYRGYTFYDLNRTYLNGNTYNPTDKKITITPTQDGYFRISYDKSCYNIQFEKGSVATNYVEHKEIGNKQHYSTEEQVIGTWIDGKPLYRKVVKTTMPTISTNGTYPSNKEISFASDVEFSFLECLFIESGNQRQSLPYLNNAGYVAKGFVQGSLLMLTGNGTAFSGLNATAIILYTKTTD